MKRPTGTLQPIPSGILGATILLGLFPAPLPALDFDKEIRPLLQEHCVECHGATKNKADLRLDAKSHAFRGSESGPVIVPHDSHRSLLYQRVSSADEDERMPPKGRPLTPAEQALIRSWIDGGAIWPENAADKAEAVDRRLRHWSFQQLSSSGPGTADPSENPIDHFIARALEAKGLTLSPPADPRTFIRRISFDLLGLPPTPEEVAAYTVHPDPAALVDRLLASPRFGERWARHWLDVVRFAESDGFEKNNARENAWPYRDYVIRAFNEDRPFDRFIREQIAGDALGEDAATGFLVGGPMDAVKSRDPVLTANQRANELHDMVSTTAATFLGLTVNCARCHDHKFDPIPTHDYYAMVALLQGVKHGERPLRPAASAETEEKIAQLRGQLAPIEAALAAFQPLARRQAILLLDDEAGPPGQTSAGVTQIEQPTNGQPITYSPGQDRGQAEDPGDVSRLPNLGMSYRYWEGKPGQSADVFSWEPRLQGRHRIWISWGAWTSHTKDARYLLDRDGNAATQDDQTEIAVVDQSTFADGSPAVAGERRWSGFRSAGEHDLLPGSAVFLRTGQKGGPHVADVMAFEATGAGENPGQAPALRAPVSHLANEDRFEPVTAKFLRFTITESKGEPCLDELEVYGPGAPSTNLALAAGGTRLTASGTFQNGANAKHQLAHLTDGRYGNDFSWISPAPGQGWVQLELSSARPLDRVVWSRDRREGKTGRAFEDRLAVGYRIDISLDGREWKAVADSRDRLGEVHRGRIKSLPTLTRVPDSEAATVAALSKKRLVLQEQISGLTESPMVYAGRFEAPGSTHRHHRGDPTQPREEVAPGALSLIGHPLTLKPEATEQERRLALAGWIADPANPLTARVIVNRLWHYHFGTGLVDTPSDFGINGSRPTHPELLDWLAGELIRSGWRLKHIHRLILLSKTYQQSSGMRAEAHLADSSSRLLWRFPPRRLEAEPIRDAMLAVSGLLDLKMGGPGFDLFEPNGNYVKVYVTKADYGPAEFRRMVYQSKPRTMLDDFFGAFDCPDAGQPQPNRTSSTTPLQALNLLNSGFALQQSRAFADRVEQEAGAATTDRIQRAFQLIFQRAASPEEQADALTLVQHHGLPALCRALYNSNEFIRLN